MRYREPWYKAYYDEEKTMKKVSVQFNLVVDDETSLAAIKRVVKQEMGPCITGPRVNNTEKRGKR